MERTWVDRLLHRDGKLRPVFRIALFFALFFLFALAGQYGISVLPRYALQWGGLIVMCLAGLLAGWIVLSGVDGRPYGALGFPATRSALPELGRGLALGAGLIAITVLLLVVSGSAAFAPDAGTVPGYLGFLGWTFLFYTLAAAFEEILFRGYPFQVLVEWIGVWPATLIASGIFSYLHGQNPSVTWLALANIFVAGVLLSIAYIKTRSLWFVTAVHVGWNWTMASVLDFPVSGLGYDAPLYTGVSRGPAWWTGGGFGPEAGLAGTVVLCAATLWLVRTRRLRPSPDLLAMRPIVDDRLRRGGMV